MAIAGIIKRDYAKRPFKLEKITSAILKAMRSSKDGDLHDAERVSLEVYATLSDRNEQITNYVPSVEEIQDIVEQTLMQSQYLNAAKAYILYNIRVVYIRVYVH